MTIVNDYLDLTKKWKKEYGEENTSLDAGWIIF